MGASAGFGTALDAASLYGTPPAAQPQTSNSTAPANPTHPAGTPQPTAQRPATPGQSSAAKFPQNLLHQPSGVIVALVGLGVLAIWWMNR